MREAYWVNEATFWKPLSNDPGLIHRTGRIQDVEDGLSEMPHVILYQARVHDMYLDVMGNGPHRMEPQYGRKFLYATQCDDGMLRVTAEIEGGQLEVIKTRYLIGCDGARSDVRKSIGQNLVGDAANQAWGVMDVLAVTDFPDIRYKSLIQSCSEGSMLVIPREGGYLVRCYVELDRLNPNERVADRDITFNDLIDAANRILCPYSLDVKDVVWWSVYEIGQRLASIFDNRADVREPNIFIAGDACHTHSPKAGQGMNVSMGDAFNLGWKLVHTLRNGSSNKLLRSYSDERQAVAKDLIEFDQEWAKIMSSGSNAVGAAKMQDHFIEHGRYTAGLSVQYRQSDLVAADTWQHLATGFQIGTRFHSAPVVRLGDSKPIELGHVQQADARWTVFAFQPGEAFSDLFSLSDFLTTDPKSPVLSLTSENYDVDSVIDFRVVLNRSHHEVNVTDLPPLFFPPKGFFGLRDYEKAFCAYQNQSANIFELRGVDRTQGYLIIVRPDQYVAEILPSSDFEGLSAFFDKALGDVSPR